MDRRSVRGLRLILMHVRTQISLLCHFSVYQMSILEYEDIGEGTPQGVVLALVGPEPDAPLSVSNGHQESLRTLRMYNLTSLMSLAKWTIAQKVCTSLFFLFAMFSPASHRALILWISAELPTGTSSKRLSENTVQQAVLHVG